MKTTNNIVVIGSSNVDMIIRGDRIPKPGETIIGGKFYKAAGGKGANQAVAAARAGGRVTFLSRVGNDVFGQEAIQGYRNDKINVNYVKVDHTESTGIALILVDSKGENCISVASGANMKLDKSDIKDATIELDNADVVLMQLETPIETIEYIIKSLKNKQVKTILNPAPALKISDDLLAHLTIITPNETEVELLTGVIVNDEKDALKASKILLDKGVKNVIITMGKKGAFLHSELGSILIPSFEVNALDTTAAGDTFNGAFAVAVAEGKALEDAVKYANAAAAISVTKMGAQPSIPLKNEIENFLSYID
tara:strand:- start:3706 stop:4635 length:930 start_codon:yes stop_codon:yes gene_type:complete